MDEAMGCWSGPSVWRGDPLLTARLKLRPLTAADTAVLDVFVADGADGRWVGGADFVAHQAARRQARLGAVCGLERTLDGRLIGVVGFGLDGGCDPQLGYWLDPACRNAGLMTEAVQRLVRHLLGDLGYDRVTAQAENAVSARLLTKVGFDPGHCLTRHDWQAAHGARPRLLVSAAALIDTDGRVLMASRPPGKTMAGLWEFPGGKVAENETPEAALVRELAEELGIDVGQSCLAPLAFASHDYDTFHLLMPLYAVRQWKGDVRPLEGQSLKWVRAAALSALPMPPADIPLVALLRDWL